MVQIVVHLIVYEKIEARQSTYRGSGTSPSHNLTLDTTTGRRDVRKPCRHHCHHAGHIPRPEEPGSRQSRAHRFTGLPIALLLHRPHADGLLTDRHDAPVRRQSDRLHPHQRHSGRRAEHVLLDSLYVHAEESVPQEDRLGGAVPGHRQFGGQTGRSEGGEVLPMGAVLSVLSGKTTRWARIHHPGHICIIKVEARRSAREPNPTRSERFV